MERGAAPDAEHAPPQRSPVEDTPRHTQPATPGLLTAGNRAVGALLRRAESGDDSESLLALLRDGGGAPLPDAPRASFEQALDHPLGHVRVHDGAADDAAARSVGADAFTVGSHVYFRSGQYAPGTPDGDRKLSHELIHVVQHDEGRVDGRQHRDAAVSSPTDPLEREAYAAETGVAADAAAASTADATPITAPTTMPMGETAGEKPDDQVLPPVPRQEPRVPEGAPLPGSTVRDTPMVQPKTPEISVTVQDAPAPPSIEAPTATTDVGAELAAAFDEQIQAVGASVAAGLAAVAEAAARERTAIITAADAHRQRLAAAHDKARTDAIAHVDGLKAQALGAAETEAARAIAGSEERAAAILAEGRGVGGSGEPPSAEAQVKAASRIADRAADQVRQTGAKLASMVRQEAAHHVATNYDPMLRDFLTKVEESRPASEQSIAAFVQTALARVDQTAAEATQALRTVGEHATASLTREKATAVAEADLLDGEEGSAGHAAERRTEIEASGARFAAAAQAGADSAVQAMAAITESMTRGLAETDAEATLARGAEEFRSGLRTVHDKALRGFARLVDDGLAGEDSLLARARAELATVPGRVDAKYAGLKGQAASTPIQRGIWSSITGWVSDLHDSAKKWFADTFGDWLGGLLLGILEGLIMVGVGLLVGWAVGAVVGFFIAAAEVAAIVTLAIMVVAGVGLNIYNRFQEFYADNPGQDAGFWRGLGLVGLGVADLTGIPFIVEGVVGQRAFGAEMDRFEANERLGMGLVFFGATLVSAKNFLRAKPKVVDGPAARPEPRANPSKVAPAGLTAKLEAIRAGLSDPRAIEQFDGMFGALKGDAAKLERILDGFAKKGPIEERLIKDWEAKNPVPEPPRGDALDQVPELKARAQALLDEMVAFREAHPEIPGMAERIKALEAEIEGLNRMLDGRVEASPEQVTSKRSNSDGIRDEFAEAREASGLTGVSRKFPLDGRPDAVEVDVVSDGGRTWTDVKSTEPFTTESNAWTGKEGHQGLRVQAEEMLRAAQQSPVGAAAPKVRFKFTKGVTRDVRAALEAMGVEVAGPTVEPVPVPLQAPDRDKDKQR
ncbi:DUF4157 domain-containing protein [Actinoplanes sp. NBRC 103695]|uniref:eCIS core domain-containing protein n=1 Tax=Actinoplanes sp. NBRC 103695 TaxID=3032202 RepID=UPI0025536881|nr:DUF4157 domain-containing protein [Actinoplanes sp. NBRC 103695]